MHHNCNTGYDAVDLSDRMCIEKVNASLTVICTNRHDTKCINWLLHHNANYYSVSSS